MCGILGIVGNTDVAAQLYDGLTVLQHRGQDAAGIATADGGKLRVHKGNGLVSDVFDESSMLLLQGRFGIGHCRYPTAGSEGSDEAQPFYVNSPYGIALAHNGNLINTDELRREVFEQDLRNVNTESDSEVLLNVFAHELSLQKALTPEAAFKAIEGVNRRCIGGYAVVITVLGLGLVAFRDPHGIRPLVLGKRTKRRAGRIRRRLRIGRARPARFRARARRRVRANASSSPRAANCSRSRLRGAAGSTRPASSSTCTSPAPTR